MSSQLGSIFNTLQDLGAFQYVLFPLLTFALIYGVLSKVNPFGDDDRGNQINTIIALVIALFAAIYVPFSQNLVVFLSNIFATWAIVLIVIVVAMAGAGLFGYSPQQGNKADQVLAAIAGLAVVFLFVSWGGISIVAPDLRIPFLLSTRDILALVVVAVGGLGVYYVAFHEGGGNGAPAGGGDGDE